MPRSERVGALRLAESVIAQQGTKSCAVFGRSFSKNSRGSLARGWFGALAVRAGWSGDDMSDMLRAIFWGGALCGTLDAIAATTSFALRKVSPLQVWHNVASGLLGAKALEKGWTTGALGLVLHFVIAFSAAIVFCVTARWLPWLVQSRWIAGAAYGILVFVVMNRIVSRWRAGRESE